MDKRTDTVYLRLPSKLKNLIEIYASEKGLRFNDAMIHLMARGFYFQKCSEGFHIEDYTLNFFPGDDRIARKSDKYNP